MLKMCFVYLNWLVLVRWYVGTLVCYWKMLDFVG